MAYVIIEGSSPIKVIKGVDVIKKGYADKDGNAKPGYIVIRRNDKSDWAAAIARGEAAMAIKPEYRELQNGEVVEASQEKQLNIDKSIADARIARQAVMDKAYKIDQEMKAIAEKNLQDRGEL